MIRYFQEGLRSSVWVKIEQRGRELNSFEELVEKAVEAKAKAALQPRLYARKTDQHCLRGSRQSAAKTSTQGQPMKDSRVKKTKSRPQESKAPTSQRSDSFETSKQARKEKKKKDKQHRGQKPQKGSTPVTRVSKTSAGGSQPQKAVSQVTCLNCNKKRHFLNKCLEPPKPKN